MDVHPTKNGINRYWSIPTCHSTRWCPKATRLPRHWDGTRHPQALRFTNCPGKGGHLVKPTPSRIGVDEISSTTITGWWYTYPSEKYKSQLSQLGWWNSHYIWVNYNNSLTWNKAILGWFPLLTMIPVRSQWGRYNLPRYICKWLQMDVHPSKFCTIGFDKNPCILLVPQIWPQVHDMSNVFSILSYLVPYYS